LELRTAERFLNLSGDNAIFNPILEFEDSGDSRGVGFG
jgi:hypothetical protein